MGFAQMGVNEWLIICGALAGPVLAVQAQKWVELARAIGQRQEWIFHSLMATRGARTSPEHVRALNSIDLAFYGRRILWRRFQSEADIAVISSWRGYFAHLNVPAERRPNSPETFSSWNAKGDELFLNMLEKIAVATRYRFDREELRTIHYSPEAQATADNENTTLRRFALELLGGQRTLPVATLAGQDFLMYLQATDQDLLFRLMEARNKSLNDRGVFGPQQVQPSG